MRGSGELLALALFFASRLFGLWCGCAVSAHVYARPQPAGGEKIADNVQKEIAVCFQTGRMILMLMVVMIRCSVLIIQPFIKDFSGAAAVYQPSARGSV